MFARRSAPFDLREHWSLARTNESLEPSVAGSCPPRRGLPAPQPDLEPRTADKCDQSLPKQASIRYQGRLGPLWPML